MQLLYVTTDKDNDLHVKIFQNEHGINLHTISRNFIADSVQSSKHYYTADPKRCIHTDYREITQYIRENFNTHTARVVAITDFTTIFTLLESIFTVHVTHDLRTFRLSTEADVASICILLEAMLTVHVTHDLWALVTLADFTVIFILLEAVLAVHHAHHIWTLTFFSALANVTAILVFFEAILAVHPAHLLRAFFCSHASFFAGA